MNKTIISTVMKFIFKWRRKKNEKYTEVKYIQLTLEPHGFELSKSTYRWIFFNSKYCGTHYRIVDMEELGIQKNCVYGL